MLMASSTRVTRALCAMLALQWLQTLSAEALEETCAKGTDGEYQACNGGKRKKLVQKATKVSLATQDQSDLESATEANLGYSAEYCLEKEEKKRDGRGLKDCWAAKPSPSTDPCTADSGNKVCRCTEADCQFDEELGMGTLAVCAKKVTYFQNGVFDSEYIQGRNRDVARQWIMGTGIEVYCYNMVKTQGWSNPKHIMKWGSDKPAEIDAYYQCWGSYRWDKNEQKCYRKKRYLGEKCWQLADCVGYKESGDYETVCRDGKCSPRALKPRELCTCELPGRRACNSPNCDSKACFPSDDNKAGVCDLTGPNWFWG